MDLVKQQLIVSAGLANDVSILSYDTSTWSLINQWKGSMLARDTMVYLPKWRSLLGANETKPILHVWSSETHGTKQPESRTMIPGTLTCLAVSPDENYCAGSVKTALYLWLISSGDLVALRSNVHFQRITNILFLSDNERVVTASQDSRIKIFSIFQLINEQGITGDSDALFTLSGHTMPISGLTCSSIDLAKNWIFSCSMDKTVKVWEGNFGQILSTFVLESTPTCILTNSTLESIFVGHLDGSILSISLKPKDTYKQVNMLTNEINQKMTGHHSELTCLQISVDSAVLFSASTDKTVKVWLVKNLQCIRTLNFESAVTNLKVSLLNICEKFSYPREKLPQFSRTMTDLNQFTVLSVRNFTAIGLERSETEKSENVLVHNFECIEDDEQEDDDLAYDVKRLKIETENKLRDLFSKFADTI